MKWPNDVVAVEGGAMKKLGGVLVEAITTGSRVQAVIVGIGLNVHARHFPDEIAGRATSVALVSGGATTPPERAELLADILAGLDRELHLVLSRGLGLLRARMDEVDVLRGREVENTLESSSRGVAQGIDDEGRLVVKLEGREGRLVRWSAGEVHLTD
jgi:BirA family biotin operon repressor/biotin-[acetyl-CoA-carboxylase] ligase